MGELTVPVKVTGKVDVSKKLQHSKESVLVRNTRGSYHMCPRDLADKMVKDHTGHILGREDKDYIKGFRMAVGYDKDVKTENFSQVAGKVVAMDEQVNIDVEALVAKETEASNNAKRDAK